MSKLRRPSNDFGRLREYKNLNLVGFLGAFAAPAEQIELALVHGCYLRPEIHGVKGDLGFPKLGVLSL